MRTWIVCLLACGMLAACFQKTEQGTSAPEAAQPDYGMLRPADEEQDGGLQAASAEDAAEADTVDHLHSSIVRHAVSDETGNTDSVWHYPLGRKIEVGRHLGRRIYLELGEFYDDLVYNGAKIYWGDSLIYVTDLEVVNDWQTCRTQHVEGSDVTYVLLLIDDRPQLPFWHIVCMNGTDIRLADYVLAGNDYEEGARYFHKSVLFRDLDGDGFVEVGGKLLAEHWADSMTYQPCYIYKLDNDLSFDEALSESETRKAHHGTFLGFENGLHIENPNVGHHEKDMEEADGGR